MDFFRSQDRARGRSRGLVVSFLLAAAAVAVAGGFVGKNKCITSPDDVKGEQTRAAGKAFEQMLAGAGASIASMASSEIYNAMQTGVLDAANTSSSSSPSQPTRSIWSHLP